MICLFLGFACSCLAMNILVSVMYHVVQQRSVSTCRSVGKAWLFEGRVFLDAKVSQYKADAEPSGIIADSCCIVHGPGRHFTGLAKAEAAVITSQMFA